MKFSAQQEYGLRCMVHMARDSSAGSVNIETIAEHEALTPAYVAKLMRILRNSGLIQSIRGQHGGYKLSRPAADITVQAILQALGDRLYTDAFCDRHSGNAPDCAHAADCAIRALWSGLDRVVENFLSQATLADLAQPEAIMGRWFSDHVRDLPSSLVNIRGTRTGSPSDSNSAPVEVAT